MKFEGLNSLNIPEWVGALPTILILLGIMFWPSDRE